MLIEIFGLDHYVIARLSRQLHHPIIKLTNLDVKDLFFSSHETMLFHHGVDQNAWHTHVLIHLSQSLKPYQEALMKMIQKALLEHTVHLHFQFIYGDANQHYRLMQESYPDFVSEKNQVEVEIEPEEEQPLTQEIYHGNVFEGKEEALEKVDPKVKKVQKKKVTN
jgi:hypothetical protein